MPESWESKFPSLDSFRKALMVEIGEYDVIYNFSGEALKTAKSISFSNSVPSIFSNDMLLALKTAKSISFEKMDGTEFENVYNRTFDAILKYLFPDITPEDFSKELMNF